MSEHDDLQREAATLRASGVLGKPGPVSRLFEFLLERSLEGEAPKELEIAIRVFGKNPTFDVSQDSVVRVYVHKLRRRLEEFYVRTGPVNVARLVLPKGQYRLTLEQTAAATPAGTGTAIAADVTAGAILPNSVPAKRFALWRKWILGGGAIAGAAVIGALFALAFLEDSPERELRTARASAIWAPLLQDDLPITIVVGDYFLLGEADDSEQIQRLVREFSINSAADLLNQTEMNPQPLQHYRNLNLTYLPAGAAFALQDIAPILAAKKSVQVVLMSELTGNALKTSHIVYIGYISGMGMLGDSVFARSRLSPGGSYDELVDGKTATKYISTVGSAGDSRYTDYAYISTFPGPNGNRIVIVAGTRDMGVMHAADVMRRSTDLAEMGHAAGNAKDFESLFEVHGIARASTNAKLMFVNALKTVGLWERGD
jgi:hypothetical protein